MAKYSYELKKEIVNEYLNGGGGYNYLAKKYDISDKIKIKLWVDNYKAFGNDGLMRCRKQKNYTFEKKLYIVELYLSSEISYRDLAIQEGITNPSMITNWVNRFRIAGPDALRSHKKGRKKTLDKTKIDTKTQVVKKEIVDISAEHVKELEIGRAHV